MKNKEFIVSIRRNMGVVKPEAEQVDCKIYLFRYGWLIEDGLYFGETAWIAVDKEWPIDAPVWIASGDLIEI